MTPDQACAHLMLKSSYGRLPALIDMAGSMSDKDWLVVLGREWCGFDNVSQYRSELLDNSPFGSVADQLVDEMMSAEAYRLYNTLPDEVVIYRGCYQHNVYGLSWSLDRDVAARFPLLTRYRYNGQPLLITATVEKDAIAALILERNETEVITAYPEITNIENIEYEVTQ